MNLGIDPFSIRGVPHGIRRVLVVIGGSDERLQKTYRGGGVYGWPAKIFGGRGAYIEEAMALLERDRN
jgi:hypothetical protein